MRLIVIKGDITGSIMVGKTNRIRLCKKIVNGEIILANENDISMYPISGDSLEVAVTIDVDRCMIMDKSGHMIGYGSSVGGVDRKAMLEAYYEIKKASSRAKVSVSSSTEVHNNIVESKDLSVKPKHDSTKVEVQDGSTGIENKSPIDQSAMNDHNKMSVSNTKLREGILIGVDEGEERAVNFASDVMLDSGIDIHVSSKFYNSIHNDIDKLFDEYPHNIELENIVFDSTWVDIDSGTDSEYAVGVIRDEGVVSLIVYAVPKNEYIERAEFANCYEWLPIDKDNRQGKGYYVSYQDAKTGEMLQS